MRRVAGPPFRSVAAALAWAYRVERSRDNLRSNLDFSLGSDADLTRLERLAQAGSIIRHAEEALDPRREGRQEASPLGAGHSRPRAVIDGPTGGADGAIDVFRPGLGDRGDRLLGRGVDCLEAPPRSDFLPRSANQKTAPGKMMDDRQTHRALLR